MTLVVLPDAPPEQRCQYFFDSTKLEARFRKDVEPNKEGEAIIIAIKAMRKRVRDRQGQLPRSLGSRAPGGTVQAPRRSALAHRGLSAGSSKGRGEFIIRNVGTDRKGLSIEPMPRAAPSCNGSDAKNELYRRPTLPALPRRWIPAQLRAPRMRDRLGRER